MKLSLLSSLSRAQGRKLFSYGVTAALAVIGFTAGTPAVHAAGQWTNAQFGDINPWQTYYYLQNDEWNLSAEPSGTQAIWQDQNNLANWGSNWSWPYQGNNNDYEVKSYPSIVRGWNFGSSASSPGPYTANSGFPVLVSSNYSVPTTWSYSTSGTSSTDISYDLFFSPSSDPGAPAYEMMVWVNTTKDKVTPQPAGSIAASNITLGGISGTVTVWTGNTGSWPITSFVLNSPTTNVSMNLQPFIYYLAYTTGSLPKTDYLLGVMAGTEVFEGTGQIYVTKFTASPS